MNDGLQINSVGKQTVKRGKKQMENHSGCSSSPLKKREKNLSGEAAGKHNFLFREASGIYWFIGNMLVIWRNIVRLQPDCNCV